MNGGVDTPDARRRRLSIGLKNDLDQVAALEPFFDFSVNEQCHQYKECDKLQPFLTNDKPVFNAEYAKKYVHNTDRARDKMCAESVAMGMQTLVLPLALDDSFRYRCR